LLLARKLPSPQRDRKSSARHKRLQFSARHIVKAELIFVLRLVLFSSVFKTDGAVEKARSKAAYSCGDGGPLPRRFAAEGKFSDVILKRLFAFGLPFVHRGEADASPCAASRDLQARQAGREGICPSSRLPCRMKILKTLSAVDSPHACQGLFRHRPVSHGIKIRALFSQPGLILILD
jgi:hypothetical protein